MSVTHRPYRTVLQTILVVWLIVTASLMAWKWYTNERADAEATSEPTAVESAQLSTSDIGIIALASGLIAIVAAMPGWPIILPDTSDGAAKNGRNEGSQVVSDILDSPNGSEDAPITTELSPLSLAIERLGHAFLFGMLIRLAGTVALFLASSYYMTASVTQIGIWVLAWHLLLLFAEVMALSRQIRLLSAT
jgi:hypothetical protein